MRIFWTPSKKRRLLVQYKTMTVLQLSKKYKKEKVEIESVLRILAPANPPIKDIRFEHGIKITVYYPMLAFGARTQQLDINLSRW